MSNEYYTPSGAPSTGSQGLSATMRAEFALIQAALDKMPTLAANANKVIAVNSGASGLTAG